jgi:hypothetical protein
MCAQEEGESMMSQPPLPKKRKRVDKSPQAWLAWHKRARALLGLPSREAGQPRAKEEK